ncbi:Hsp70 family protein [Desulfosediminicola flagellatus]|uniref:Hsp70 family protein n=1 Tax=Desulfosediminicola flagellatus TaxID=2569541 RepID=UPI0010AD7B00|nr:Hsp70 family protein [Desulfosediminicola flagellatus]
MGIAFGIDFGTSNSSLSINVDGKTQAIDLDDSNDNTKLLRSIIFYDYFEHTYFFGQHAIDRYIETDADGRYIQSVKSYLPDLSFKDTQIGGRTFTLEKIISLILEKIKMAGESQIGCEVDDVVIGRPVIFSEIEDEENMAQERLIAAAKLAGFKNIHLEYEPIAAAMCYEQQVAATDEQVVLVCDFGGGTSDFSVIKVGKNHIGQNHDRKQDILSLGGIYIGGDTLDSLLMWEEVATEFGKNVKLSYPMSNSLVNMPLSIMSKLKKWHLTPLLNTPKMIKVLREIKGYADQPQYIENLLSLIENNYGYTLFKAIEKTKIDLSSMNNSSINYVDYNISIHRPITIERYNAIITHAINKIENCIIETVSDAGLRLGDIDKVILTGGTSNVSLISTFLDSTFGPQKTIKTDTFTSVGQGLGICGSRFV